MSYCNKLTIESLNSDWWEKGYIMLHACYQLLRYFIKKENLLRGLWASRLVFSAEKTVAIFHEVRRNGLLPLNRCLKLVGTFKHQIESGMYSYTITIMVMA